eukprot:15438919-Alexandrium_andersonii.AAC.1
MELLASAHASGAGGSGVPAATGPAESAPTASGGRGATPTSDRAAHLPSAGGAGGDEPGGGPPRDRPEEGVYLPAAVRPRAGGSPRLALSAAEVAGLEASAAS